MNEVILTLHAALHKMTGCLTIPDLLHMISLIAHLLNLSALYQFHHMYIHECVLENRSSYLLKFLEYFIIIKSHLQS